MPRVKKCQVRGVRHPPCRANLRQRKRMSFPEITLLTLAAFAAGAMNAVAGGGTILTFPALLLFGMPAIQANATSTLALLIGILGSVFGYRRHIPSIRPLLPAFGIVSTGGGLIGALLLTCTSEIVFSSLVPYLLLFATLLFLANGAFRRFFRIHAVRTPAEIVAGKRVWIAAGFQFLVAIYGGYFGAGIGILMLASLGILGMQDIHQSNTLKTLLGALVNLVAAIYFILAGLIIWPQAMVMTLGATAGYFGGSSIAQKIPQPAVRAIAASIGLGISALLFFRQLTQ